jgi:hypothetical protein
MQQLPHLSHHAMATVPTKTRRKASSFLDCVHEAIYLFGGKDEKGGISGKLIKLKVRESGKL